MRIGIDAELAQNKGRTGLGGYVHNLLKAFALINPENMEFYLFHSAAKWAGEDYGKQFVPVSYRFSPLRSAAIALSLNKALINHNIDLYHVTCTNGAPPFIQIPVVTTVHDLYPLMVPGACPYRQYMFFRVLFAWTMINTGMYVADSVFGAAELINYAGISPEKVKHVPLAAYMNIPPAGRDDKQKPYILCVGAIEKRKGQVFLLESYLHALKSNPALPELAFIGPDRGDAGKLLEMIRISGSENKVKWLRFVDEQTLIGHYQKAALVCVPSFYEGFGVPPLEAMKCELPLFCADIPVLHETGKDYPLYLKHDVKVWADALNAYFTGQGVKFDRNAAKMIAESFSWERCAREMLDIYKTTFNKFHEGKVAKKN